MPLLSLLEKEPVLLKTVEYIREHHFFNGTATEFTTLLDLDMQPNMLSRKIRSNRQELLRFGVSFEPSRDRQKRSFLLRYVSACDGVTVPTRGGAASSRNPESVANTGESA